MGHQSMEMTMGYLHVEALSEFFPWSDRGAKDFGKDSLDKIAD